ncbi:AzlC family ABC transporter permease [Deinococcus multiflagellatus]|uniref:AzlC family ABC transporter permease n=1 Tax=Deinococcus multiflagellatus TaxID=1656887 RepID=UPI001CCBA966|nr:AzlC family ABC transporter permease [Deinococcus multiflagellatus]MBZ9712812.1 AzlC family ABC transporter permease [Deinococcus multiflagellatus]
MSAFWQGFRLLLPLWPGMIPFAVAYAVTARGAGLSLWDTCLMSLTVFAGASQFAAAGQFVGGQLPLAPALALVGTTFLLNVRHLLYGLSLSRTLPLRGAQRAVAAQFLTDEAFGMVTVAGQRGAALGFAFLLGAELSLYVVWNASTLLGALAGQVLPSPAALGVGVIFPLAFLGLLVPLLGSRHAGVVALAAGLGAWALSGRVPGGVLILAVGVGGALLGAWLTTRRANGAAA